MRHEHNSRAGKHRNQYRILGAEPLEPRCLLAGDFLMAWAAGLVVGDFNGSRGGIFVSKSDGSDIRQLTVSQTDNFEFSGHGLNLPDDHPSISPDGRQIVFTTSRFQEPGDFNNFEIALMNVDGSNVRRLTNSSGMDTEPVFSPDGKKIAFVSDRGWDLDIWSMNIDGTGLLQLTNGADGEVEPAWSHSGSKLAFTRVLFAGVLGVFGARKDVYIMNADGSNKQLIAGLDAEEHDAVWSVDDNRLIFTSERDNTLPFGDVAVIDIATKQYVSNLTVDDRFLFIGGGGDPSVSPDGSKIAYFKATGGPLLLAGPQKIHVMNANGSGKVKIDAPGIINVHPHLGKLADSDQDGKPDYIDINSQSEFNQAMIQDEARVVAKLGLLTSLNGLGDIGRLATRGYVPAHFFDSFQGMGVAFARDLNGNDVSVLGEPDVLLYQPDLNGVFGQRDPVDILPDFNYRLIGWGYASNYDPKSVPAFAGFPDDAWLVHEAGFHRLNGEFSPTIPAGDNPRGTKPGNVRPDESPATVWHERLWDIHFFRKPNGGNPVAAILDPFGRNLPGNPTGTNAFFFPQLPYRGTPRNLPLIEAEDFDMGKGFGWNDTSLGNSQDTYRVTDVDIAKSLDKGAGHEVVFINSGEFLQYTIDVPVAGAYELAMRFSNGLPGGQFHIEFDGINRTGAKTLPVNSSTTVPAYASVPIITTSLTAGTHQIRFVFDSVPAGGTNPAALLRFNSFTLAPPRAPSLFSQLILHVEESSPTTDFNVTYVDSAAINVATIATGNIQVTGPNQFSQIATLISKSETFNSPSVLATYRINAPGTGWDPNDNGIYTLTLLENSIRDATGVAIVGRTISQLNLDLPEVAIIQDIFRSGKILVVSGSESADRITLTQSGNQILVDRGDRSLVTIPSADITEIHISVVGGNDTVNAVGLKIPIVLDGGDGNDTLFGQDARDELYGEAGNDVLMGGNDDDFLFGSIGRDILIGGRGRDQLFGGGDEDILLGDALGLRRIDKG